jgi:2-succinyl-5-enolpyruvyl-6-hydroxy-3-cyclohexene-1-carboxylate synthase
MSENTDQAAYAAHFVGGLADTGVDMVFISPGSRNAPLTLAFAGEPRIRDVSVRDERSAGFAALGYAKATGVPAVVVCTSGSAAAHYLPAIVEADQSATPMIVITADRPIRLRGTGAPQTMDQVNLYGSHVKLFVDLDTANPSSARNDALALARSAMTLPQGPAHGNAPFDEPLVPDTLAAPSEPRPPPAYDTPNVETRNVTDHLAGRNVLIVVGGRGSVALSRAVNDLANRIAAPVIADPQANITGPNVLEYGDLVVAAHDADRGLLALGTHTPDVVLRLGPIPTAKPLWAWMESSGVDQVLVHSSRLTDPLDSATIVVDDDPLRVLASLSVPVHRDRTFLDAWVGMDRAASSAVEASVAALPFPNEPAIARTIAEAVPDHSILFVGSSRPIRDLDAFGYTRGSVTVIANRGVNGIDGAISTALGAALTGTPTTLYIGDVTALHDISALSEVHRLGAPLRIVVVNNDGGGIFSFLRQARSSTIPEAVYERHWGTPHGLAIAPIAASMGLVSRAVSSRGELAETLKNPIETPELLEIVTVRQANVDHHRIVARTVEVALHSQLGGASTEGER